MNESTFSLTAIQYWFEHNTDASFTLGKDVDEGVVLSTGTHLIFSRINFPESSALVDEETLCQLLSEHNTGCYAEKANGHRIRILVKGIRGYKETLYHTLACFKATDDFALRISELLPRKPSVKAA